MAETLPASGSLVSSEIKTIFKDRMDELLVDLGRKITLHLKSTVEDCPNCGFNDATRRSNRKYNSSNPNTLNGPKHRAFSDGQICPICNDQGV